MSVTDSPRRVSPLASVRAVLARPLASYQLVLGATFILLALGLLMVLSASSVYGLRRYGDSFYIFLRQGVFAGIGVVGMIVAMRMQLSTLRKLAPVTLLAAIVLLGLTFTPLGMDIQGNRNWLPLFAGFNIQPSEFAKLSLIVWIAAWYTKRERVLTMTRYIVSPVLPVAIFVTALVVLQKDLGTALILAVIAIGMIWLAGLPARWMWLIGIGGITFSFFFVATADHRRRRFFSFMDPSADPEGTGYQSLKAMLGFARGGFWGLGLGNGRQKWGALPEAHNDFIVAVIGEELGLAGSLVLLVLFATLCFAACRIAMRTNDTFAKFLAAGIALWIMTQAIVNIGMVLGVMPVIGVPLPLVSYGGSSLIATLIAMGILANCATTEPGAKAALTAARKARKKN